MGKIRLDKKIETGKKQKKDRKICFTPHKWLICMLAARSAGPATAAIAATAAAATTRATLGGQVSLGHPLHIPPLSLFFHDESWRKLVRASFFSHNIFSLSQKAQCLSPILIPILKRTAHLLSVTLEKERALKLEDRMEEKRCDKAFFRRASFLLKNSSHRKCFSRLYLSYPQNRCEELQSKDCCFHECPPLLGPPLQKLPAVANVFPVLPLFCQRLHCTALLKYLLYERGKKENSHLCEGFSYGFPELQRDVFAELYLK